MTKSYIRGPYAIAACSLIDELKRLGVQASAVGYLSRKRDRTLIVVTSADPETVPAEWMGFRVVVQREGQSPERIEEVPARPTVRERMEAWLREGGILP